MPAIIFPVRSAAVVYDPAATFDPAARYVDASGFRVFPCNGYAPDGRVFAFASPAEAAAYNARVRASMPRRVAS